MRKKRFFAVTDFDRIFGIPMIALVALALLIALPQIV
jgi:hypothetical protein